jgi:hypothetical protein
VAELAQAERVGKYEKDTAKRMAVDPMFVVFLRHLLPDPLPTVLLPKRELVDGHQKKTAAARPVDERRSFLESYCSYPLAEGLRKGQSLHSISD